MQTILREGLKWAWLSIVALWQFTGHASEPTFVNVTDTVTPGLPQIGYSSVAWADFDQDGRPDFLIAGISYTTIHNPDGSDSTFGEAISQLWRNTGNGFSNVTDTLAPGLPGVSDGSVAWGDYDNDGRPDFLFTGRSQDGHVSQIWRNTGTGFSNVTATVAPGLPEVSSSSVAWGDYDNDGRLDFLITGHAGYVGNWVRVFISQIWRNTGSGFTNVTDFVAPGLPGVTSGSVAWGDYDNDGRLDFLITGGIPRRTDLDDDVSLTAIAQLWRNTGSGFVNLTAAAAPSLTPVFWSSVAWADYDNDGRLDFLLTGYNRLSPRTVGQLWRNTENGFVNVTASVAPGLPWAYSSSVAWGDYDNDGRPDLLLTGEMPGGTRSQIWRNTPGGFTNMTASVAPGLTGVVYSSVAWSDYDNDGRLDLLLTGALDGGCDVCDPPLTVSQLWRNNTAQTNPAPVVITKLPASATATNTTLSGAINPHGQSMTGWFLWGNTRNYDHITPAQPIGSGDSLIPFSETIAGLNSGWIYYRAVGSNVLGQVFLGQEQYFYLTAPVAYTDPAQNITANSATLHARVFPQPNRLPTYGWFEWGLTPAYDQVTPVQFLGELNIAFAENIFGLEEARPYYFRAVVSNALGLAYGPIMALYTTDTNGVLCPGSVSPLTRMHGWGGGASYDVYLSGGCDWTVVNTNSWITVLSATNGIATSTRIHYAVAANPDPQPRSGSIVIGGHSFWITQSGGHPIIVTQPASQSVFAGGTATFSVGVLGANPTFQWQLNGGRLFDGNGISGATTANLVLNDVQMSQAGEYRVDVGYTNSTRHTYSAKASLTVSCTYDLSAHHANSSSLSATGSVTVNTLVPTCPWSVVNTNPWVVVLSSVTNRGNGTVAYAVAANPLTTARSASILIADQLFTITQAGGSSANPDLSLEEALDTDGNVSWSTIGTPAWVGQSLVSHDGVDAAQSGPITNSSAVTAVGVLTGPGTLSFWWKVSSETNKDYLKFFINGVQQTRISGEVDWQLLRYTFPSGSYTSKWTYSKSEKGTAGNDRGWLDQVRYTTDAGCAVTLSKPNATHSSAPETGQVNVSAAAGCPWNVLTLTPWITNLVAAGEGNGVVSYTLATNSVPFSRTGTIVIAGQPFTITQMGAPLSCAVSLWPTSQGHDWPASSNTVTVSAWAGCEFGVSNTNAWVTIQASRNLSGFGWVQYAISANTNSFARAGYIHIDAQPYYIYQSGKSPCSYNLQPISIARPAEAATGVISVTTLWADCPWTVSTTDSWISILSSPINAGNGQVTFSISANLTQQQRIGKIQIANQVFSIAQSAGAPCSASISPISRMHNSGAATGTVDITIQASCPWSVSNANAWVTILSGGSNSTGPVIYSIASNTTSVARSGNIGIAGRIFSILQSANAETNFVTLSEALDTTAPWVWTASGTLPWLGQTVVSHDGVDAVQCAASGGGDGGSGGLKGGTVAAASTLSFWWKVSSEPNNDTLRFYLNGAELARISGEVNWQQRSFPVPGGSNNFEWRYTKDASASAGQDAAWVDQVQLVPDIITSCVTLSPGSRIHGFGASTNSFVVSGAVTCNWTVSTTNAWISILSPSSGTGNSSILYVVASNPTASTRSGSINVGGQNFLISQSGSSGGCALSVTPTSQTHGYGSATGTLAVTVQSGCTWTVMNTNPWVSIISSRTNSGNGTVLYSIAANTNAQARTGVVRIGLQTVLLTQGGTALSGTNAPWLQFMNRTETGATLAVQGAGGKMYVVEYSVDLIHWIPISTNSAPSIITDPSAAPRRFYRTVESP